MTSITRRVRISLTVALFLTAGCGTTYESQFQCPIPTSAGGCRTLQQVYAQSVAVPVTPPAPDPDRYDVNTASAAHGTDDSAPEWSPPVKTVWIAPYLDSAGRRHEASLLRIVVFAGPKAAPHEPEFLLPPVPDQADQELVAPTGLVAPQAPAGPTRSTPAARQSLGGPSPRNAPVNSLFTPPPAASSSTTAPGFGLPGY